MIGLSPYRCPVCSTEIGDDEKPERRVCCNCGLRDLCQYCSSLCDLCGQPTCDECAVISDTIVYCMDCWEEYGK